ncbi:LysR family transcriptional regulator [Murdochiella massiliensis]|uniref:LysR family transcriptional regulator n=1 Tax=Murdochiella massiliensis TaxID=1673723 RepID=UPI0008360F68|nr:LysR family transcriptional regulator [Murdochiella massiliensis]
MTFRQLKYFSVIFESKSLVKASSKLYISQQGLSRILMTLESEIGQLFFRKHNGLEPTPLGTMLYVACQPVLHEMSELEQIVSGFSRLSSKRMEIGLIGGTRYLNSINIREIWSKKFQSSYPDTRLEARELSYAQGLELLSENKLDMITYSDYISSSDFVQIDLKTWDRVLLVPKGHPLNNKKRASPKVLKNERLILYINERANQSLLQYCKQNECYPDEIVYLSDTLYMYDACQKEGCLGLTINEYYTNSLLPQFSSLTVKPFTEKFLPYTVSVLFREDHKMAKVFYALADELKIFFANCIR